MPQRLIFNVFCENSVTHVNFGQWRAPNSLTRYWDRRTWTSLAREAERGFFDAVFFADLLGASDVYEGSFKAAVRSALYIPGNDPSLLVPAMAEVTTHLGFVFTSSVIQEHPFNFARRMSTLDHLTEGRVGWNVVTSYLRSAYRNFGYDELVDHHTRYSWAEEYLEVVYKLWQGSWSDRAVLRDTVRGIYADADEVRPIDHEGARYRVAGPHLAEPSPQRTPVIFQAGASESGRDFAARHAEGVFLFTPSPSAADKIIRDIRRRAELFGRNADDIIFLQALSFVVGRTPEEAAARLRETEAYDNLTDYAVMMSGNLGTDLSNIDLAQPLEELKVEGTQGFIEAVRANRDKPASTFGDLVALAGLTTRIAGTPEQIADEIERWADVGVGGINVAPVVLDRSLREFVDLVVPVLQRRGLMQTSYAPGTLREKLFRRGPQVPANHPAAAFRFDVWNPHAKNSGLDGSSSTLPVDQ